VGFLLSGMKKKEDRLILLLSRTVLSSEVREEVVKIMRNRISWEYVVSQSTSLDIAPLFYYNLKKVIGIAGIDGTREIPEMLVQELKDSYYSNASQNIVRRHQLCRVLEAFQEVGIPAIVLKGAALAELVYPHPALRPMVDVDLLIRYEDLDSAEKVLQELEYVPYEEVPPRAWWRENHHHLVPYFAKDKLVFIELHHHIVPPSKSFTVDIGRMWERAVDTNIAGTRALVLSPEDTILHLSLHLAYSSIGGLKGLCDISEMIRKYKSNLNWEQIIKESKEYEIERYIYYQLWLAKEMLDAEIPSDVLRHLEKDIKPGSIEDRVLKGMIKRYVVIADQSGHFVPLGFIKLLSEKLLADMKRTNVFMVFLSSVLDIIKISARRNYRGSRLMPLYMLFHIFRLLFKYTGIKFHRA
jgi:hypothetical protein